MKIKCNPAYPALLALFFACLSCSEPLKIEITSPVEGAVVYGILCCSASVTGGTGSVTVSFYHDAEDNGSLIEMGAISSDNIFTADWYTTDVVNGSHTLYAVARDGKGSVVRTETSIQINNLTRADTIPGDVVKMTPANDPHPPLLNPDLPYLKDMWEDPVPLPGPVNTAGAEDSPFITPDGDIFFFWFNGDERKTVYEQVDDPMTGIYRTQKVNGSWTEPERIYLNYFGEQALDGAPTMHNNTLWFCSARAGNYRGVDMWTAELRNGRWSGWTNAGEKLNRDYEIGELHVTADGLEIYFDSSKAGGYGEKDIWVTGYADNEWQAPVNIDILNTEVTDGWPWITEDGSELWFTRYGSGYPDIYRSLKAGTQWQAPEKILTVFAGEPTLDREGNIYFAHHRWDEVNSRVSEADIYVCYRKKP